MSDRLIQALQDPRLYGHPVQGFQLIETHISWVILTGEYAYKIKKPMNFGFLDFTTLERRRHYCEQELALNRRLAPELYLQVLPITGSPESPAFNGDGPVIEYAIQMRQFDQDQLADRLQARGGLTAELIDQLIDNLAAFHQDIPAAATDAPFGQPEQVMAPVWQNFEQIRPHLTEAADRFQLDQIEGWANSLYDRLKDRMAQRKAQGFIRECHGDIHLGNVTLIQGKPTLFDCIEFNDAFRWIDVMSDLAFLLMDLEDRGVPALAHRALNQYLERTGDYEGVALLDFYKSYRAMVRAKVALLSLNPNQDQAARDALWARYRRYAALAESYTFVPNRCLIITEGVSGSGKSTLSSQLVDRLGLIRLRSDVERKRLHGLEARARSGSELDGGIYTQSTTEATYRRLASLADQLLTSGKGVIADATFLKREQRQLLESVAESQGVPFVILSCDADPDTIRHWVRQRHAEQRDASEAGLEVLEKQLVQREPLGPDEREHQIIARTDHPEEVEPLLALLGRRLGRPLVGR